MKKIVINISNCDYEKFRLEAMHEKKDIPEIIKNRIFIKLFHPDVEKAYEEWMQDQFSLIMKDE